MFPGEAHELPNVLRPLAGVDETSGDEAALRLQRAILPTPLQRFSLGRYDLSVRYRPAESGNWVCGDWYDARLGPDGRRRRRVPARRSRPMTAGCRLTAAQFRPRLASTEVPIGSCWLIKLPSDS